MKRVTWFVVFLIALGSQPAWAARTQVHEAAESQQYGRKFGGMIGRGVLNAATCFVDVIVNVVNETKNGPPLVGTLTGVAKGTGCGVLRLGSGAADLVTFWVPGFNGFPVSDSYENCLAASVSATSEEMPLVDTSPVPASTWETPTTKPEATRAPASPSAPAKTTKKKWTK